MSIVKYNIQSSLAAVRTFQGNDGRRLVSLARSCIHASESSPTSPIMIYCENCVKQIKSPKSLTTTTLPLFCSLQDFQGMCSFLRFCYVRKWSGFELPIRIYGLGF